ncbi:hypothetical protein D047_0843B, partial [Vibrio parahaemolyticus VPTS-2010_2]
RHTWPCHGGASLRKS